MTVLSAGLYASCSPEGNPDDKKADAAQPETAAIKEWAPDFDMDDTLSGFTWHEAPQPVPQDAFKGPDGQQMTMADFKGKLVVLNFWATWCGPCRHEMPSLDHLQGLYDADDLVVVALSNDRQGPEKVEPFFEQINIQHLKPYYEDKLAISRAFKVSGYPTTVLINADGMEIGRTGRPAMWDNEYALAIIDRALADQRVGTGESPE